MKMICSSLNSLELIHIFKLGNRESGAFQMTIGKGGGVAVEGVHSRWEKQNLKNIFVYIELSL